jgi:MFS superfamily sulfate permease-like transporter
VLAAKRVALAEYLLLLSTFVAILALGLELGIAAGIAAAALQFTWRHAAAVPAPAPRQA